MNSKTWISLAVMLSVASVSSISVAQTTYNDSKLQVANNEPVIVYSSRKEHLIKPLFQAFTQDTGVKVDYINR